MTNHVQCDLHRRNDEAARCRVANAAAVKSKRNRQLWLERANEENIAGNYNVAKNIFARVAEYDAHGWGH